MKNFNNTSLLTSLEVYSQSISVEAQQTKLILVVVQHC